MPRARSRFAPARAALTLGAAALLAGSAACSSDPGDGSVGKTDEASTLHFMPCSPGYARVGSAVCEALMSTDAYVPMVVPVGATCSLEGPIAVPPELEGYGCSLGVSLAPDDFALPSLIWACPIGTPVPRTLSSGGYFPYGSQIHVAHTSSSPCLGNPIPGYEFIEQIPNDPNHPCPGGCPAPPGKPIPQ